MTQQTSYSFTSFNWKRLLCGLLLLAIGLIDLIIFSPLMGRHIPTGSIMSFEGPSYFISTGLVPLLVGFILILYCMFSYFKGIIISENDRLEIKEQRFRWTISTTIEREKIIRMNLTNNETGIKYLWLFLFVPYLIINYYYMILNFLQPFIIGLVNFTALIILTSLIGVSISMIILFFFPQWLLEIYTTEGRHELWFEPIKNAKDKIENIALNLGIMKDSKSEIIKTHPFANLSIKNLIIALVFFLIGIFNVIAYMTTSAQFQTLVCYVLIIIAIYLLSNEFRKLPLPVDKEHLENLRYIIQSKYYRRLTYIKPKLEKDVTPVHEEFEVFWGICTGILFIVIPAKIIQAWMIINSTNASVMIDNAFSLSLFGLLILYLLINYILVPSNKLVIKADGFTLKTSFISSGPRGSPEYKESFFDFIYAIKMNFKNKENSLKFLKRVVFISIAILIGMVFLLWEYFNYINLFNIFNL